MSYIKFNDGAIVKAKVTIIDEHTLRVDGSSKNTSGFKIYTDADVEIGNYSDYRYDYENKTLDKNVYEYTNDNHKWVKPVYKTTFLASNGGKLEGQTTQIVDTYSQLNVPTPIADENYVFDSWTPEIPKSGNITTDQTFTAQFVYVETLIEVKEAKISEISAICNQVIEEGQDIMLSDLNNTEHFYYKSYDQQNMKNAFDIANMVYQATGQKTSIPFYDSNNQCRIYSYNDIATIYISCQNYITYNLTLAHQLQAMIKDIEDKDAIKALVYSESQLSGEYKDTFDEMLAQAKKVTDLIVGAE